MGNRSPLEKKGKHLNLAREEEPVEDDWPMLGLQDERLTTGADRAATALVDAPLPKVHAKSQASTPAASVPIESSPKVFPWRWLTLAGATLLAIWLAFTSFFGQGDSASPPVTCERHVVKHLRIEEVRLGQRLAGRNPEITDEERTDILDIDPAAWRQIDLRLTKPNGKKAEIALLRPVDWIEVMEARVGGFIALDLEEMGLVGPAEVVAIGPCPPIEDGEGSVVTGRFAYEPEGDLVSIAIEGLADPIRSTANHPYWSESRREFVAASELRPGDLVQTLRGSRRVAAVAPCPATDRVYNLEVHGEHVYIVAATGVLVHNQCAKWGTKIAGV